MSMQTAEQERLVVENKRLVHFIAKRYYQQNMEHDDFAQVGMIGLIKASRIFDAKKDTSSRLLLESASRVKLLNQFEKNVYKLYRLTKPFLRIQHNE
ncbi:sigma factor [Lysinibacillus sp. BSL11]